MINEQVVVDSFVFADFQSNLSCKEIIKNIE